MRDLASISLPSFALRSIAPTLAVGGALLLGCGAPPPAQVARDDGGTRRIEDRNKDLVTAAGDAYEAVAVPQGTERCAVKVVSGAEACGANKGSPAAGCPIAGREIAECNVPVADLGMRGSTIVFSAGSLPSGEGAGFGIWRANGAVRTFHLAGGTPLLASAGGESDFVVRREGGQIVDYRIDDASVSRRRWSVPLQPSTRLFRAEDIGDRWLVRLCDDAALGSGLADATATKDHRFSSGRLSLPSYHWGVPLGPAWTAEGQWTGLGYGSSGVGLFTQAGSWGVPRDVAQNGTQLRALAGEGQGKVPVLAFVAFDMNDRSGVHVILPSEALPATPADARRSVKATDLHLLATRSERKNDCPSEDSSSPARRCARSERHAEGLAIARHGSDPRVWLAVVERAEERSALTQIVCPRFQCVGGRPCVRPPCERHESDVKSSIRYELRVLRLDPARGTLESALRWEMRDVIDVAIGAGMSMSAAGGDLHFAFPRGPSGAERLRVDTTRLSPSPVADGDVKATPIVLAPTTNGG